MLSSEVLLALCAGAGALAAPGVASMLFGARGVESGETRTEALWTSEMPSITGPVMGDNIHAAVGFNGLGIMPGHNTAYLSACRISGHRDEHTRYMLGRRVQIPIPGEFYRSMLLKPAMKVLTPV